MKKNLYNKLNLIYKNTMEFIIFFILGAFLFRKLYSILGSENEEIYFQSQVKSEIKTDKKVIEINASIEEQEDLNLYIDQNNLELFKKISLLEKNNLFTINFFISLTKNVIYEIIKEYSNKNLHSLKDLISEDLFNNFQKLFNENINISEKIEILNFQNIKIVNINEQNKIYQIALNVEMIQLIYKDSLSKKILVSEKWYMQKDFKIQNNQWKICRVEKL